MKKFLSVLLAVVLAIGVTFTFAACGNDKPTPDNPDTPDDPTIVDDDEKPQKMTEHKLVTNGDTTYKLVLPADADGRLQIAAAELTTFFRESTNITLETISDNETYDGNYISLGETAQLRAAGLVPDYDKIGINGYRVKTEGKNLFIAGGGEYGTLYGTYRFLHDAFGYEFYAKDCYTLDRNVTEQFLPDYDEDVVPDIQQLMANYGATRYDRVTGRRLGVEEWGEIYMAVDGGMWHNFFCYVPWEEYGQKYPEWFSRGDDGDNHHQLCLSNEQMYTEVFLPKIKQVISENPDLYNISISQNDANYWCRCADCKAEFEKYGTDSAIMIKFLNKTARDVKAWLREQGIERKLNFVMFAYHKTTEPPVVKNEDGTYSPIDETVRFDDDCTAWYAPIYAKWTKGVTDEVNKIYYDYGQKWKSISSKMFMWGYETCFSQYLVWYNTFGSMQDWFRFYKDINVEMLFSQGQHNQAGAIDFNSLKMYLQSKLRWNVNANVEKLTQNYFDACYGEASADMRQMYDDLRLVLQWHEAPKAEGGFEYEGGVYSPNANNTDYWTKGTLDHLLALTDAAYEKIEPLKTSDPDRYNAISDRICLETIAIRYLLLLNYSGTYSSTELYEMRKSFRSDTSRLSVSHIRENKTIDEFTGAWQI